MFLDTTKRVQFSATSASGGTAYFTIPFKGRIINADGTVIGTTGKTSAAELTFSAPYNSSVGSIGVLAFSNGSSSVADGSVGTYTKNGTYGSSYLSAGSVVKVNVPAADITSTCIFALNVEFTPY